MAKSENAKDKTKGSWAGWTVGVFLIFMLIGMIAEGSILSAAVVVPAILITLPPIYRKVYASTGISLSRWVKVAAVFVLVGIAGTMSFSAERDARIANNAQETNAEAQMQTEPQIDYEVLRSWNPNNNPQALGREILISKEDVSQQNISSLLENIATDSEVAAVRVYSNRTAWEESQTSNYTDAFATGYLAYYVKNEDLGNEYVRWFQEEGVLEGLYGTETQI